MSTLVSFHAHPDDEAIACGGTLARASAAGHRVVLVLATRGELGDRGGPLVGEELARRRVAETEAAAEILGVQRIEFLGFRDSGMMGTPANDATGAFWRADPGEAAARLEKILLDEDADVLTIYDAHGGYGHPDHIQVHRVGSRAGLTAGVPHMFEATLNRDHMLRAAEARPAFREVVEDELDSDEEQAATFGMAETQISHAIDVTAFLDVKRRAIAAHSSQIDSESFFLALDDDDFAYAFGTEWFAPHGRPHQGGPVSDDLFQGVS